MSAIRTALKAIRAVSLAAIFIVVSIYAFLYVAISVPSIQRQIKDIVEKEFSLFLKSKLTVGDIKLLPFNEVKLSNVMLYTPDSKPCITINRVEAGISLLSLIRDRKITISYVELVGFDGRIWQEKKDSPLNINFLLEAFKPKRKNKPPTKFDLSFKNVVIRNSSIRFDKLWKSRKGEKRFDINHLMVTDIAADIVLPRIKNDDFEIVVKRLAFRERSGLCLKKLSMETHITQNKLDISNILLEFPNSQIQVSDLSCKYDSLKALKSSILNNSQRLSIKSTKLIASDFAPFLPQLSSLKTPFSLDLKLRGTINKFKIEALNISNVAKKFMLIGSANVDNCNKISEVDIYNADLKLASSSGFIKEVLSFIPTISPSISEAITNLGDVKLESSGDYSLLMKRGEFEFDLSSAIGKIAGEAELSTTLGGGFNVNFDILAEDLKISPNLSKQLRGTSFVANGEINKAKDGLNFDVLIDAEYIDLFQNVRIDNVVADLRKDGNRIDVDILSGDDELKFNLSGYHLMNGALSETCLNADIQNFVPTKLDILHSKDDYIFSGLLNVNLIGNNEDNLLGSIELTDPILVTETGKRMSLSNLKAVSESVTKRDGSRERLYKLNSDVLEGEISGVFSFPALLNCVKNVLNTSMPALVTQNNKILSVPGEARFMFCVYPNEELAQIIKLPIQPLDTVKIDGVLNTAHQSGKLHLSAPYLAKGKATLIKNTLADIEFDVIRGVIANVTTSYPIKKDYARLNFKGELFCDKLYSDIGWVFEKDAKSNGIIQTIIGVDKNIINGKPEVTVDIRPSGFVLNGADWVVEGSRVFYSDNAIDVDNLRMWHDAQFLRVDGKASANPEDKIIVSMADMDLSYIFETLNINYVTFGGRATGEFSATDLMTKTPVAKTNGLKVTNFSYNGAILGDADIKSHWDNEQGMVSISAEVTEKTGNRGVDISGGIYVTKDSLSLDMTAREVNVEFMKPFFSGFTSHIGGRASGKVKLFGTFRDIDLWARINADSVSMKIDQTNVVYTARDSILINPGFIRLPNLRVNDRYGNTARLHGRVKHNCFRDIAFDFRVTDATNILGFQTDQNINPVWYGTIFASGDITLNGGPGYASLMLDVTTSKNTDFSFVLNSTQTATDYKFLTFTDRRKKRDEIIEGKQTFLERFMQRTEENHNTRSSIFNLDIRANITNEAKLTLVMDPKTGDKITAHGNGPMQLSYDTESGDVKIYGKYTLQEGIYNFSLQDFILKDFHINSGSSISFNGNPMHGTLDINAYYRVNTNISDLDKSFLTDKELNRTNVPVDALLYVKGDIQNPEIDFDIALPTLTQDVARKVKSIISTEDMMNRQIIYLLALNRFYTPEYMNTASASGGELASVASSTISSQLSNMVGQLTDKISLSPSFRSEKGDFSDMEVDVALSSRLLDNRLIVNGNLGYRDPSSSTTTFIGDFDLEYLLTKGGNLRMKAYNHFNDQNYYLKSAMTTQGIGLIYRREFVNPFKKKNEESLKQSSLTSDSVTYKESINR